MITDKESIATPPVFFSVNISSTAMHHIKFIAIIHDIFFDMYFQMYFYKKFSRIRNIKLDISVGFIDVSVNQLYNISMFKIYIHLTFRIGSH